MSRISPTAGKSHVTETPDVSHIKNVDVTHELSDVNVAGILKFVGGLTILTIVVYLLMLLLFHLFNSRVAQKDPPPGPMALTEKERYPPDPKLQSAPGFGVKLENGDFVPLENKQPQKEYQIVREEWETDLATGARDQSGRVVGLPIDQAMEKILQAGLPTRSQVNKSARLEDFAISMPTASSSGRMTEKRLQ